MRILAIDNTAIGGGGDDGGDADHDGETTVYILATVDHEAAEAARRVRASGATTINTAPRYAFSLVPIQSTFDRALLHDPVGLRGAPTIRRVELPGVGRRGHDQEEAAVVLGRNMDTMIKAEFVSRQLVDIRLRSNRNSIVTSWSNIFGTRRRPPPPPPTILLSMPRVGLGRNNQMVRLNGTRLNLGRNEVRELRDGDVLALHNELFKYTIHLDLYEPEFVNLLNDGSNDQEERQEELADGNNGADASSVVADPRGGGAGTRSWPFSTDRASSWIRQCLQRAQQIHLNIYICFVMVGVSIMINMYQSREQIERQDH